MKPLISIVIPTYNRQDRIAKAIQSVKLQTYTNWEAIVVDDGSTDKTTKTVQQIAEADNRIRLIVHGKNRGAQAARNTGIRSSRGYWISFLDSDDEYLRNSLKVRFEKALIENVAVVHSGSYIRTSSQNLELYRINQPSGRVYRALLTNENPMFPALLVAKHALERIGYLDEKIISFQEWDTFIRLAKFYKFAFIPTPTFIYDYRTRNAISRNSYRVALGYNNIVRKHFSEILTYAGPKALSNHYRIIADWYLRAGFEHAAKLFSLRRLLWLCCSPQEIKEYLKRFDQNRRKNR